LLIDRLNPLIKVASASTFCLFRSQLFIYRLELPKLEQYFKTPENPDYVVITFAPQRIEYYHGMTMDVWQG
jgi:general stress protein 26